MQEIALNQLINKYIEKNIYPLNNLSVVKISGEQAQAFLQGQLTCDLCMVNEQNGTLGALCNHQGRVLATFFLYQKNEDYFCLLDKTIVANFIHHLNKFAVFSKVTLEEILKHYYGSMSAANHEASGINFPGLIPRQIIISDVAFASDVLAENNLAWRLIDFFSGLATIYPATRALATPHMLNLPRLGAVSFNKGCYVGQEIIARTQYLGKTKRHLCLAQITGSTLLAPGDLIYEQKQEAGFTLDSIIFEGNTYLLVVLQEPLNRQFFAGEQKLINVFQFDADTP